MSCKKLTLILNNCKFELQLNTCLATLLGKLTCCCSTSVIDYIDCIYIPSLSLSLSISLSLIDFDEVC